VITDEGPKLKPRVYGGLTRHRSPRYEAVNAMLLNEFLKEHRTVEELKKEIAALTATVKEQASQIQKVSAKIELSKARPPVIANVP
jgi:hypothetical protein